MNSSNEHKNSAKLLLSEDVLLLLKLVDADWRTKILDAFEFAQDRLPAAAEQARATTFFALYDEIVLLIEFQRSEDRFCVVAVFQRLPDNPPPSHFAGRPFEYTIIVLRALGISDNVVPKVPDEVELNVSTDSEVVSIDGFGIGYDATAYGIIDVDSESDRLHVVLSGVCEAFMAIDPADGRDEIVLFAIDTNRLALRELKLGKRADEVSLSGGGPLTQMLTYARARHRIVTAITIDRGAVETGKQTYFEEPPFTECMIDIGGFRSAHRAGVFGSNLGFRSNSYDGVSPDDLSFDPATRLSTNARCGRRAEFETRFLPSFDGFGMTSGRNPDQRRNVTAIAKNCVSARHRCRLNSFSGTRELADEAVWLFLLAPVPDAGAPCLSDQYFLGRAIDSSTLPAPFCRRDAAARMTGSSFDPIAPAGLPLSFAHEVNVFPGSARETESLSGTVSDRGGWIQSLLFDQAVESLT